MDTDQAPRQRAPRHPARRGGHGRVRRTAPALALAADLLARRMGLPPPSPLLERRDLPRPVRRAPPRRPDPDLQGRGRDTRDGLGAAVPGRVGPALPASVGAAVRLRAATGGRMGRAGHDPADPLPRALLGRPPVPVPDGPLRLDRLRYRRAARARAAGSGRGPGGDGPALLGLLFSDLGIPFVAAATIWWRRRRSASRAPTSSRCRPPSGSSGTWAGGTTRRRSSRSPTSRGRPAYMLDGLSASVATWVGLGTLEYDASPLDWGRPLLVAGARTGRLAPLRHPATLRSAARRGRAGARLLVPDRAQHQPAGPGHGWPLPVRRHRADGPGGLRACGGSADPALCGGPGRPRRGGGGDRQRRPAARRRPWARGHRAAAAREASALSSWPGVG